MIYRQTIELVRAIRDTWRRGSDESETSVIEKYRSVGLLILDEVGVSFGGEAEKTQIFDVLDGRYREMRPTLIVSNLSAKGLPRECASGERGCHDRLIQNGSGCVVFDWGSYRPGAALATLKRSQPEGEPNEQSGAARMRKLRAEAAGEDSSFPA